MSEREETRDEYEDRRDQHDIDKGECLHHEDGDCLLHACIVCFDKVRSLRLALETATQRANELEDACAALVRERDEAIRTVNALTPAANYCLQYKPLLMKAERERDEAIRVLRDIATYGWYAKGAKVARAYLTAREGR